MSPETTTESPHVPYTLVCTCSCVKRSANMWNTERRVPLGERVDMSMIFTPSFGNGMQISVLCVPYGYFHSLLFILESSRLLPQWNELPLGLITHRLETTQND